MDAPDKKKITPLGLIKLPDDTIEKDFVVLDKYQAFSAELLRLSLLAIGGIGFLIANVFKLGDANGAFADFLQKANNKISLVGSLILFGLTAAFALLHRYYSSDSIACQLHYYRMITRGLESDFTQDLNTKKSKADIEKDCMRLGLKLSTVFILLATLCLGFSSIFLCISFIFWLFPDGP